MKRTYLCAYLFMKVVLYNSHLHVCTYVRVIKLSSYFRKVLLTGCINVRTCIIMLYGYCTSSMHESVCFWIAICYQITY